MKTLNKTSKNILKGLYSILFLSLFIGYMASDSQAKAEKIITAGSVTMAAMAAIPSPGRPNVAPAVNPAAVFSAAQAGYGSGTAGRSGNGIYNLFESFTFFADNTGGGAAATWKMQSADGLVEVAQGASLATNVFDTPDLTTVAGVDLGGANLTGLNCIRRYLFTVPIYIDYINYTGSNSAQINNSLLALQADPQGQYYNSSNPMGKYLSNMQFNAALVPITKKFVLTANHALKLTVADGQTATLVFSVAGIGNYAQIIQ
jgi:hypothetical protein